jgi:cyclase
MAIYRIIPCLLLRGRGFVKTIKFGDKTYLGDPINIVRIFNEKEVDEIAILNIEATIKNLPIDIDFLNKIATECYVPLMYGGGIRSIEDARSIFKAGFEKISINTMAIENPSLLKKASDLFGSQSVVASIDVKKNFFGHYNVFTHSGKRNTKLDPVETACILVENGAGEILLNSIDRDGTYKGYDTDIIQKVSKAVNVPVIACGGASNSHDLISVIETTGASAAAAGSLFVFHGPNRAVLINMPSICK